MSIALICFFLFTQIDMFFLAVHENVRISAKTKWTRYIINKLFLPMCHIIQKILNCQCSQKQFSKNSLEKIWWRDEIRYDTIYSHRTPFKFDIYPNRQKWYEKWSIWTWKYLFYWKCNVLFFHIILSFPQSDVPTLK